MQTEERMLGLLKAEEQLARIARAKKKLSDARCDLLIAKQEHKKSDEYIAYQDARDRVKECEQDVALLVDEAVDIMQSKLDLETTNA